MLADAIAALRQVTSPPFRAVLYRSLGLTLALLALLWTMLHQWAGTLVVTSNPWLAAALSLLTGLGLLLGAVFMVAPVSSLVAGFFFDDMAALAEGEAGALPGAAQPILQSVAISARFAALSLLVNICALLLFLLPGVNLLVFFVANAFLLGREYFSLAALRYRPAAEVRVLRRRHGAAIFAAGFFIALFVAVPVVNLLTPLFGAAFMARLHKRLTKGADLLPLPAPR